MEIEGYPIAVFMRISRTFAMESDLKEELNRRRKQHRPLWASKGAIQVMTDPELQTRSIQPFSWRSAKQQA
ncbi:unnamed protein product [Strongylus vulgaris]|uniref:Uncharacterized protein n=1 Tax=Strongylus vulgaris TaxID=40348 RepID=A0A3P7J5D6_STRVU|nr:unnamed protein product [Strongylus vulgaris]